MGASLEYDNRTLKQINDLPTGNKISGTKKAFELKADNEAKARMIVQGWIQVPGTNCAISSVFAPVCTV